MQQHKNRYNNQIHKQFRYERCHKEFTCHKVINKHHSGRHEDGVTHDLSSTDCNLDAIRCSLALYAVCLCPSERRVLHVYVLYGC